MNRSERDLIKMWQTTMLRVLFMKHLWPEIRSHPFRVRLHPTTPLTCPTLCLDLLRPFETLVAEKMEKNASLHLQNIITSKTCGKQCHTCFGEKMSAVVTCPSKTLTRDGDRCDLLQPVPPGHASSQTRHTEQVGSNSGHDCGQWHTPWWKHSISWNTLARSQDMLRTVTTHLQNRDQQDMQWHTYHNSVQFRGNRDRSWGSVPIFLQSSVLNMYHLQMTKYVHLEYIYTKSKTTYVENQT